MKKRSTRLMMVIVLVLLTLAITTPVFASGGQVRGENGAGAVNQVQVQDPPPFQP